MSKEKTLEEYLKEAAEGDVLSRQAMMATFGDLRVAVRDGDTIDPEATLGAIRYWQQYGTEPDEWADEPTATFRDAFQEETHLNPVTMKPVTPGSSAEAIWSEGALPESLAKIWGGKTLGHEAVATTHYACRKPLQEMTGYNWRKFIQAIAGGDKIAIAQLSDWRDEMNSDREGKKFSMDQVVRFSAPSTGSVIRNISQQAGDGAIQIVSASHNVAQASGSGTARVSGMGKYDIEIGARSSVGAVGDGVKIEGGMHFGKHPPEGVNTGGGAFVGGSINLDGGDFTGRDRYAIPAEIRPSGADSVEIAVRKALIAGFSDGDITTLAFDTDRSIYNSFGAGMGKNEKARILAIGAKRRGDSAMGKLLRLIAQGNPAVYNEYGLKRFV